MTYVGLTWTIRLILRNLMAETSLDLRHAYEVVSSSLADAANAEQAGHGFPTKTHKGRLELVK